MMKTAEIAKDAKHRITIKTTLHRSYCGGMMPTEEQRRGFYSPLNISELYITNDSTVNNIRKRAILKSEDGLFHVNLEEGDYFIYHPDKLLSLQEFKTKNVKGNYTQLKEECFHKWQSTPDFYISASQDSTYEKIYRGRCFVGENPCLNYSGPYPP